MTVPAAVVATGDDLAAAYRRAWASIAAAESAILADPRPWRRIAARRAFLDQVAAEMVGLDAATRAWFAEQFPAIFAAGADSAVRSIGATWTWTDAHIARLGAMAAVNVAALRRATRATMRTSRVLVASLTRHPELLDAPSDDLRRLVVDHRVYAVRYSDRSRHGLAEYGPMVLAAAITAAYAAGTLGAGADNGVSYYSVSDGRSCGWTHHDDPDVASGSIRSALEASDYPLGHPNCRRSFAPWTIASVR